MARWFGAESRGVDGGCLERWKMEDGCWMLDVGRWTMNVQ
jgi:hypothetical protein